MSLTNLDTLASKQVMQEPIRIKVAFLNDLYQQGANRHFINDFYRWLEYDKPAVKRRHARSVDRLPGLAETADRNEADVWILPMTWNYYIEQNRIDIARSVAEEGTGRGKKVIAFSTGDFTANVPFKGLTIFEASVYRSRNTGAQAMPVFIEDYLEKYCGGRLVLREKQSKPVVGFCGQASSGRLSEIARSARLGLQRTAWKVGARKWEPATVEHTALRSRVLENLARSPLVQTHLIRRKKYKGGDATGGNSDLKTEFVRNIVESDYTVCVRGTGNFSTRFYETLCLGRIPIFVDTDCRLPFDEIIDWKRYCIWVTESEIDSISEKVAEFHSSFGVKGFAKAQRECRQLWVGNLQRDTYYQRWGMSPQNGIDEDFVTKDFLR